MRAAKISALQIHICNEHAHHWGPKGFLLGKGKDQSFSQYVLFICFWHSVGVFSLHLSATDLQYENTETVLFGQININRTPRVCWVL